MDSFQEMLRKARQESGYSMRTVSRLLLEQEGIAASRTIINFLEKGARPPTYEIAYGLSAVLGVNPEEMMAAAYIARLEHDKARESEALKSTASRKKVSVKGINTILDRAEKG